MSTQSVGIGAAVGTRNGVQPLPNQPGDLAIVTDLFDRITSQNGGTSDVPGSWPVDRISVISQVTAQIQVFQSTNNMAVVDSAIDPGGATLRLMNQLAADPPLAAVVADAPGNFDQDLVSRTPFFAAVTSMAGTAPLVPTAQQTEYSRRLVSVNGSSIKWFGVVLASSVGQTIASAVPHIFFTPTPHQHPAEDYDYDSFGGGWGTLWDDYTDRIGGLVAASGVNQILVIPFYKNAQASNLGSFLTNWQDVVSAVVTAAVNDINPYYLADTYSFDSIVSASFSNGIGVHQGFHNGAIGAKAMTSVLFDLDGQAQLGGSNWHPAKGIFYLNKPAPRGMNPQGTSWYVGGRWSLFDQVQPQTSQYSHHACSQFLLFHGLWQFSA